MFSDEIFFSLARVACKARRQDASATSADPFRRSSTDYDRGLIHMYARHRMIKGWIPDDGSDLGWFNLEKEWEPRMDADQH